jgi:hypothetical protein
VKIDNGPGGSRETSTDGPDSRPGWSSVDERGGESIKFFAELKRRTVWMMDSADVKFEIGNVPLVPALAAKE